MLEDYIDKIICGDCLEVLKQMPDNLVNCCITSPPYWGLRDYGMEDQIGCEKTPEEYVSKMVDIFREVKRVLKDEGTLWLNLGDSYYNYRPGGTSQVKQTLCKHSGAVVHYSAKRSLKQQGLKEKDLVGIPWMVAFALRSDGWYLRQDIIWHKPNPMPESVKDRPTKSHEYIFLMSKNKKYYYNAEAIKEKASPDSIIRDRDNTKLNNTSGRTRMGGLVKNNYEYRNKRSVWTIPTQPFKGAHFAVFPPRLITPMILAGCIEGGIVLDPFMGSGTTAITAMQLGRHFVGIELNKEYVEMSERRIAETTPGLFAVLEEEVGME